MAKTYQQSLESIARTVTGYREGEITPPSPAHIDKWARQFDEPVRERLIAELDHVLERTYIPKSKVEEFLGAVLKTEKLAGKDPCAFWKTVGFLDIQSGGQSQKEMLRLFDAVMRRTCGYGLKDCKSNAGTYVYLDDVVFTGNRVLGDLRTWVNSGAPEKSYVHVVTMAFYRGGQYYAQTRLDEVAKGAKKEIKTQWWRILELEDRKNRLNLADVLRPRNVPSDPAVQEYAKQMSDKYPLLLRTADGLGENKFYSSEEGRSLLEQEFLRAGVRIRSMCPYLNEYQRPLGNIVLKSLGFGSMIVTFRNCPNNAPLALWAGNPWYPLFPRKVN
jgi:hypothetical protein